MANRPVDLLIISWNRRDYLERTVSNLLDDSADFRLYCWDNASADGAADIIASLDDPRIVKKQFSKANVNQREPCLWFFDKASSDVVGKIDDDILMPHGWIERISPLVREESHVGMLGCWTFMPEDWDECAARRNVIEVGAEKVFRCVTIGGCAFLARTEVLKRYLLPAGVDRALPIDRNRMSLDGLVNGYPVPLMFAHHMDDPRSPHCTRNDYGGPAQQSSVTARARNFQSSEEYAAWIARDAWRRQHYSYERQLWWLKLRQDHTTVGKIKRTLLQQFRPR